MNVLVVGVPIIEQCIFKINHESEKTSQVNFQYVLFFVKKRKLITT